MREVVSYIEGTHMPRPGRELGRFRLCMDCLRRLVRYTTRQGRPSWRHYWRAR